MDCSLPDSSIHGIFQARVVEWGAIAFSVVFLPVLKFLWLLTLDFDKQMLADMTQAEAWHVLSRRGLLFYVSAIAMGRNGSASPWDEEEERRLDLTYGPSLCQTSSNLLNQTPANPKTCERES